MKKRLSNPIMRRPKLQDPKELDPPYVSVADEADGLIKTVDLESDIIVEFPLWEAARFKDSYQLRLDGNRVGELKELDPLPPEGTTLQLSIPIDTELLTDGHYTLDYVAINYPGSFITASKPITLIVDRTPPGTHQLGYMDFPDVAKDGLTAEELRGMGDVLTGSIFGYSGLQKGDTIQTFWGEEIGPSLTLDGNEDEEDSIDIGFTKAFLTNLTPPAGATYYKVTDRAGNISAESRRVTIPLFLTEITPDLPAPVIENDDGVVDLADATIGVNVQIPGSNTIEAGDQILLYWGSELLGPVPIPAEDLLEPYIVVFSVQRDTIEAAGDGIREISYEVIRAGHVIGVSSVLQTVVHIELPVPGSLGKPIIKGASSTPSNEDNLIDENDYELNATVMINWNSGFKSSQIVRVYWGGIEVLEQPYVITNSDVVAGRALLLTALNSLFKTVGTGTDIRVYYTVEAAGNPNTSESAEQAIIVRSKDELPGGPEGPDAPEFTNAPDGVISYANSAAGAPVYIKPYINIESGQSIIFTYEAYDDLVGGNKKFEWTHTSAPLTQDEVLNGYHLIVPYNTLRTHCFGHTEASFQVKSDKGQGNSSRTIAYVDMRNHGGFCVA